MRFSKRGLANRQTGFQIPIQELDESSDQALSEPSGGRFGCVGGSLDLRKKNQCLPIQLVTGLVEFPRDNYRKSTKAPPITPTIRLPSTSDPSVGPPARL